MLRNRVGFIAANAPSRRDERFKVEGLLHSTSLHGIECAERFESFEARETPTTLANMAEQMVSVTREIKASPEVIFELLADPARHADFDGSGMLQQVRGNPGRLGIDSRFRMDMKMGPLPYRISSKVVEFDEGTLIAWAHMGKHRWRYELEPIDNGAATTVTETFDWSTAVFPKAIELAGYAEKHPISMEATLERLAALVEK